MGLTVLRNHVRKNVTMSYTSILHIWAVRRHNSLFFVSSTFIVYTYAQNAISVRFLRLLHAQKESRVSLSTTILRTVYWLSSRQPYKKKEATKLWLFLWMTNNFDFLVGNVHQRKLFPLSCYIYWVYEWILFCTGADNITRLLADSSENGVTQRG